MRGRMSRGATLVLVLLAAFALLAPAVLADHVYSHQYRVFGRVVDAEGAPLSGALVFIEIKKTQSPDRISFRTDCLGNYGYKGNEHFHIHGLSTIAELSVAVYDPSDPVPLAETLVPADRNVRKTHLNWELEESGNLTTCEGAAGEVSRQVHVFGRLWNVTDEKSLEGITVWGETPTDRCRPGGEQGLGQCEPVEVVVTASDGRTENATAWTDRYGDYFATFTFDAPVEAAAVEATWLDMTVDAEMDPLFHNAEVDFIRGTPPEHRRAPAPALVFALFAGIAAALLVRRR